MPGAATSRFAQLSPWSSALCC